MDSEPKFTAIVQHYYKERLDYIAPICAAIQQAGPAEIIIWNNGGADHEEDLCHALSLLSGRNVITTERNTLLGRYAAALIAETDIVYIQDDDLIVEPETIQKMVRLARKHQRDPIGIAGCRLSRDYPETPYTKAQWLSGNVDVVLGRAFACHRAALIPGIFLALKQNIQPGRCDDIFFSMANGGGFVIPDAKFTNLDERGIGLSHEPEHFAQRDAMARRMLEGRQ